MTKSPKKLLLTAVINLFLVLLCLVAVTYAWLSNNKYTESSPMQIVVNKADLSFDYTVYQYNAETNTYTDNGTFVLAPYDMIITSRNEHSAIIIKLDIFGAIIDSHSNFTINFLCSDTQLNTRSLSNVTNFKAGLFNINSNDAEVVYTTAETNFKNLTAYKFKTTTKATQVSIAISNYASYISDNKLTVYIQIDYDATLAEEFNTITVSDLAEVIENPTIVFSPDVYELNIATVGE